MADIRVYKYRMDWADQIDTLLKVDGIDSESINKVFNDVLEERVVARQKELYKEEVKRELSALVEQYVVDTFGDAALRNYTKEDYDVLAASILKDIDDNMEELLELESMGYRKVEHWSDAELAMDGAIREDVGAVGQRRTTRREATASRVAQNSPEKVLADFVKNL